MHVKAGMLDGKHAECSDKDFTASTDGQTARGCGLDFTDLPRRLQRVSPPLRWCLQKHSLLCLLWKQYSQ